MGGKAKERAYISLYKIPRTHSPSPRDMRTDQVTALRTDHALPSKDQTMNCHTVVVRNDIKPLLTQTGKINEKSPSRLIITIKGMKHEKFHLMGKSHNQMHKIN